MQSFNAAITPYVDVASVEESRYFQEFGRTALRFVEGRGETWRNDDVSARARPKVWITIWRDPTCNGCDGRSELWWDLMTQGCRGPVHQGGAIGNLDASWEEDDPEGSTFLSKAGIETLLALHVPRDGKND